MADFQSARGQNFRNDGRGTEGSMIDDVTQRRRHIAGGF
jgi:hypothetical protein